MGISLIIKNGRFSYLNHIKPRKNDKGEENWSTSFIIPKTHPQVPEIKEAISKVIMEKWPDKKTRPNGLHIPLRDGDTDRENDAAYAGCYFINCNGRAQPKLLDAQLNELDAQQAARWTSGDYGHIKIDLYPFVRTENKGVGVGLVTIVFKSKGEPLSNRTDPMEGFEAEEIEDAKNADGDDIFG